MIPTESSHKIIYILKRFKIIALRVIDFLLGLEPITKNFRSLLSEVRKTYTVKSLNTKQRILKKSCLKHIL